MIDPDDSSILNGLLVLCEPELVRIVDAHPIPASRRRQSPDRVPSAAVKGSDTALPLGGRHCDED